MIEKEQRQELIRYRIEQAKETAKEADLMLQNNLLRGAVNRIYYAMFYMLLALALKYEFTTSKHGQLIGWFNKNFIKNEVFDKEYGKILREAFDFRQQGDYGIFTELVEEDVENKFNLMHEFIAILSEYILK
jgi:uncharacterized protein (UPF0332 family)